MLYSDESAVQRQQKPAWSPGLAFFHSTVKEVYTFASQDIVIEEGLDSYAGMIWPGVSDPSFPTIWQTTVCLKANIADCVNTSLQQAVFPLRGL